MGKKDPDAVLAGIVAALDDALERREVKKARKQAKKLVATFEKERSKLSPEVRQHLIRARRALLVAVPGHGVGWNY